MAIGGGPVEFHCNGLCKIYVFDTSTYLGYTSEAGVQLEFDPKFSPIHTDAYGDQVPEDIQNMGMLATINFELIKWDQTVLGALQSHAPGPTSAGAPLYPLGSAPNSGTTGANSLIIGAFLKQCNWNFPIWIDRSIVSGATCETNHEGAFEFYSCYVGPDSFNLGTKNTRHRLTINCLPNASGQLFAVVAGF